MLRIILTREELIRVKEAANDCGCTRGEFVRLVLDDYFKQATT